MELNWTLHPKHINVQLARSAAYQYRLQEWNDGQAELTVHHREDRPSARPIKRFVYKNRNAAFGGAKRFEDQHGYRDDENDRINRLCAQAWDEGRTAAEDAQNPYRKAAEPADV